MTDSPTDLGALHEQFTEHVLKIVRLTSAAAAETARFPASINLMEAIENLRVFRGEPSISNRIDAAKDLLPLIEVERSSGFPLFHGLAAMGIWSSLEAFIEDILLGCMALDPAFADVENVRKLKVPLFEFESMSTSARRQWILENVELAAGATRKPGVGKFEAVLNVFGLGGDVDDECRACLVELAAVRNVLAHRNGRADGRFTSLCPWLGFRDGDEVQVTRDMLVVYGIAAVSYGTVVYRRVLVRFGQLTDSLDQLLAALPRSQRTVRVSLPG